MSCPGYVGYCYINSDGCTLLNSLTVSGTDSLIALRKELIHFSHVKDELVLQLRHAI